MTGDTLRLPTARVGFAALPEGALLHDDRYEILAILKEHPEVNIYLVRDNQPIRRCPSADCRSPAAINDTYCSACGTDLSGAQPIHLTYLLREAADPARFNVERELLDRRLSHPGLLLPTAHFIEIPYADSQRAYLLVPESPSLLAASLSVPQQLSRVLNWGLQLANGMAYLHEQRISVRSVDLNRVAIADGGRVARWTDLDQIEMIPPSDQDLAAKRYTEDVQNLAQLLLYLSTGLARYDPTSALALPTEVKDLFARATAARQHPFRPAEEFGLALEHLLAEVLQPVSISTVVGRRSHVGLHRELNEDGLLCLVMDKVTKSITHSLGLFAVADGMGGHSAGEVAAQLTLDALRQKAVADLFTPAPSPSTEPLGLDAGSSVNSEDLADNLGSQPQSYEKWIADAIAAANTQVYKRRLQTGTDMGNTIVLAVVAGDTAFIGNVGDSRAYFINQKGIHQITTDHSLVARLVATGSISPEEARIHPRRNVIYRTIGDKPQVEMDLFTQLLGPGDHLLLCSDGLSGMITDQEISEIVRQSESPQQACDRLVRAANNAGGEDNISVIVVQILVG